MNLLSLIPGVKDYEKILFVIRRHKITFLPKILFFVLLLAIPWLLYAFLDYIHPIFLDDPLAQPVKTVCFSAFYLFSFVFFFTNFVDYFLDVWIITNERIVDVNQEGIFARTVAETRFYRVQDVTSEVKGFLPTVLSYGNVYVQTASETERIIFQQVPHPYKIAQKIMELVEADKPFHAEKIKLMQLEEGARIVEK